MLLNYNNRKFRPVLNSETGEVSGDTLFRYRQKGNIVTGEYSGGAIITGSLIAKVDEAGNLDMRYQHINADGIIMTGKCSSIPEVLFDGRIRLHETWQWTSGDFSSGNSIVEEVNA